MQNADAAQREADLDQLITQIGTALETAGTLDGVIDILNPGSPELLTEPIEGAVLRLINVPLTDGQFDAVVSFTYNLGGGALQRSTLRRKINREEHAEVSEQFMHWVWAGGRKLKGLVRRRAAESNLYACQ